MTLGRNTIRILSIDGGGMRGLMPAHVLRRLDQLLAARMDAGGRPLGTFFDLVSGASTGAIIAAGVAASAGGGMPLADPERLIRLYRDDGRRVFARSRRRFPGGILGPKYLQQQLAEMYETVCGDAVLSECLTNLLIPAYDIDRPGVFHFRGGPDLVPADRHDFRLREVLLAATAAPYHFPPVRIAPVGRTELRTLVDGGVFASNPTLRAYLEARQLFGAKPDVLILSLGTGTDAQPISYHAAHRWGLSGWLNPRDGVPLIQLFMNGQADDVHENLRRMVPDTRQYFRIDLVSAERLPAPDDISEGALRALTAHAEALVKREDAALRYIAARLAEG